MKRLLVTVPLVVLAACGGGGGAANDRPGDGGVYARIDGLSDCTALQDEFDQASANNDREEAGSKLHKVTLSYMDAADDRMKELGCYDK